jgi:mRNA-degrading endonuclease RelE of RelBE toxin-antitoxin system
MTFKVYRTSTFDKEFAVLPKKEQDKIENFEKKQLTENPFVGDSLGYDFFREKRLNGRRVYYLIYEDIVIVLLVAISDKKTQQATINEIKMHLSLYYDYVKDELRKI